MEIKYLKIEGLKPFPDNPRKISKKDLTDLINDIKEFGFVEPIVVNADMTIIGGHQRILAAKQLKMTEVPAFMVDLPFEKAKILNLALNKVQGEWDYDKLQFILNDMPPEIQRLSGFSPKEVEKIMFLFQEDNVNLLEEGNIDDFERENKNHEIRILIPKDYPQLEEIKGVIMKLKESCPEIIIKEVM